MFTPAPEFDYREILIAQLQSVLLPFTDTRRGLLLSEGFSVSVDLPSDIGRLVGTLFVSFEEEVD